jgi:GNAT superfamily N-acetyltransferase
MAPVEIRPVKPEDADDCGTVIYTAFQDIAARHGYPADFPSREVATHLAESMARHPNFAGFVAESGGFVVGSNFIDRRDAIAGVGPITVDPGHQGSGVGRRLMRAVLEQCQDAAGVRLVQESFNSTALPLYASMGFDVKEPLAVVRGRPNGHASGRGEVRPMAEEDIPECAALCQKVHGWDRANEVRDAVKHLQPFVMVRDGGRVAAYATNPTFWLISHGVAETEEDMTDLLLGAAAAQPEPVSVLVPVRQAKFFRWCLEAGMRVIKPMTLMAMGGYQEPKGTWFPSVAY